MEVKIKPFDALPCALEVFTINSINADQDDFGVGRDVDEYNEVAQMLESALDVGRCGWCD